MRRQTQQLKRRKPPNNYDIKNFNGYFTKPTTEHINHVNKCLQLCGSCVVALAPRTNSRYLQYTFARLSSSYGSTDSRKTTSGFKSTSICPYNRDLLGDADCALSLPSDSEQASEQMENVTPQEPATSISSSHGYVSPVTDLPLPKKCASNYR